MRKKSILMVCISALIALTMFVGCDNAPVLPSFVVGGNVIQTGDFLTGQNFDPSKFSVTVTYDNGKIVAADDTVSVMIVGDETVEAGDTAIVDFGIDYKGNHVTKEVAISVYDVQTLSVEGPTTYVEDSEISKNDLKVTATYYANEDGVQTEKTMILTPAEYSIIPGYKYVANEPSVDNPEVEAYVEISALGATGKFNFTATFDDSSLILADQIKAITAVTAKASAAPYAWDYGYDPQPSFDDVAIMAFVGEATQSTSIPEDLGFTLTYVDDSTGLPIDGSDYSAVKKVRVRAEINGSAKESAAIDVKPVTVKLEKAEDAKLPELVKGAALPAVDKDNFIVTYTVDGIANYADMENVEFLYSTLPNGVIAPANGVVPASGNLYIYAKYNGVTSASIDLGTAEDAPAIKEIKSIDLVDGFSLVKQIYEELPEAISAVESITVVMDDKAETEVVIPVAEFGDDYAVIFTRTNLTTTEFTSSDLSSIDSLYVRVDVGPVADYAEIKLTEPVVDALTVNVDLGKDVDVALYGKNVTLEPVLTTTAGGTLAVSLSDLSFIDAKTNKYVDSTTESSLESGSVTLDEDAKSYKAILVKYGELVESAPFEIPAGISYIDLGADQITATNFEVAIDTAKYTPLVDEPLSTNKDFYTVKLADAVAEKVVPEGAEVKISIDEIVLADGQAVDTSSKAYARISYVGPEGKTVSGLVEFAVAGKSWVEGSNPSVTIGGTDIESLEPGEYDLRNAVVTGLEKHGDISWSLSAVAENDNASVSGNTFEFDSYGSVTVTLSWFDGTKVDSKSFSVGA